MSTLAITNTFAKKTILDGAELRANFTDVSNWLNCAGGAVGIEAANIQGAVGFSNSQIAEARGVTGQIGFVWINSSHSTQSGVTSRYYWQWWAFEDYVITSFDIIPNYAGSVVTAKAYLQVYNPNVTTPVGEELSFVDSIIDNSPRKALSIPVPAGSRVLLSLLPADMTANVLAVAVNVGIIADHSRR